MNSRQARQMMKRMGIDEKQINATQVIIKTPEKTLVFDDPQVSAINMAGQETFQLSGSYEEVEEDASIEIDASDVQTVAEQASCDEETARTALEEHNGDIAAAILSLSE